MRFLKEWTSVLLHEQIHFDGILIIVIHVNWRTTSAVLSVATFFLLLSKIQLDELVCASLEVVQIQSEIMVINTTIQHFGAEVGPILHNVSTAIVTFIKLQKVQNAMTDSTSESFVGDAAEFPLLLRKCR